jgi:hypothetical protein
MRECVRSYLARACPDNISLAQLSARTLPVLALMTQIDNQATHIANSHVLSGGKSGGPSHPSTVLGSGMPMGVLRCTCCLLEALHQRSWPRW